MANSAALPTDISINHKCQCPPRITGVNCDMCQDGLFAPEKNGLVDHPSELVSNIDCWFTCSNCELTLSGRNCIKSVIFTFLLQAHARTATVTNWELALQ